MCCFSIPNKSSFKSIPFWLFFKNPYFLFEERTQSNPTKYGFRQGIRSTPLVFHEFWTFGKQDSGQKSPFPILLFPISLEIAFVDYDNLVSVLPVLNCSNHGGSLGSFWFKWLHSHEKLTFFWIIVQRKILLNYYCLTRLERYPQLVRSTFQKNGAYYASPR